MCSKTKALESEKKEGQTRHSRASQRWGGMRAVKAQLPVCGKVNICQRAKTRNVFELTRTRELIALVVERLYFRVGSFKWQRISEELKPRKWPAQRHCNEVMFPWCCWLRVTSLPSELFAYLAAHSSPFVLDPSGFSCKVSSVQIRKLFAPFFVFAMLSHLNFRCTSQTHTYTLFFRMLKVFKESLIVDPKKFRRNDKHVLRLIKKSQVTSHYT